MKHTEAILPSALLEVTAARVVAGEAGVAATLAVVVVAGANELQDSTANPTGKNE